MFLRHKSVLFFGLCFLGLVLFAPSASAASDDFMLKSPSYKLCLDGHGRGRDVRVSRCRTPFKAQRWTIDIKNGQIKHTNRNLCLAVSNSNRSNGARVVLWPCNYATNQRWDIPAVNTPNGQVKSALNGKCLDVSKKNHTGKLANVHMWDCHKGKNQLWQQVNVAGSFVKKKVRRKGRTFYPTK